MTLTPLQNTHLDTTLDKEKLDKATQADIEKILQNVPRTLQKLQFKFPPESDFVCLVAIAIATANGIG